MVTSQDPDRNHRAFRLRPRGGASQEGLEGMLAVLYVDAEAVEGQLVKEYGTSNDHTELLTVFWDSVERSDVAINIARVPSDSNPADDPSRGCFQELRNRSDRFVQPRPPRHLTDKHEWKRIIDNVSREHSFTYDRH